MRLTLPLIYLGPLLGAAQFLACASTPRPAPQAPPTPGQLLGELQPAVERAEALRWEDLGVRVPIELADRFVPLRLHLRWRDRPGVAVAPALLREPPACDARAVDLPLLARFTGEELPTTITGWTLSSPIPAWMHFISAGVLLPFTLERKYYSRAPERADLLRRVPAALALYDALGGACDGGARCEQVFLVPRAAAAGVTISLLMTARRRDDGARDEGARPGTALGQLRARVRPGGEAARFSALPPGAPTGACPPGEDEAPSDEAEARARAPAGARTAADREAEARRERERRAYPPPLPGAPLIDVPPPPEQPATPAESLAARPPWEEGRSYAPWPDVDLAALWSISGGAGPRGPLRGALLLCEFGPERFGRADTSVELRLGAAPPWATSASRFALPLAHLQPGEPIVAAVRATTPTFLLFFGGNSYTVTTLRGRFGGARAFALRDRHASLECRAAPDEAVAAVADRRLRDLGRWLAGHTLGLPRFDVEATDWGLGRTPVPAAQAKLRAAAALIGWSDPRLRPFAARVDEMARAFERDRAAYLTGLAARGEPSLPEGAPGSGPQLAARVAALRCTGGRCDVEVEIRNQGTKDCEVGAAGCGLDRPCLVWADGARAAAEVPRGAKEAPRQRIAPGEAATLRLGFRAAPAGPPLLLSGRLGYRPIFLPLPR